MRFFSTLVASVLGTLIALGMLIFFFILFIFALSLSVDTSPSVPTGSVLVVDLSGDIPEVATDDPFLRLLSGAPARDMNRLRTNLRKAAADDRIGALWLQLRGTSSSWATLGEIRDALAVFKESGKPVYGSTERYYMDEADYFVASIADSVFASPEALFEFNGFFISAEFYKPLLDRLQIAPQVIRAGEFKSAVEPFLRENLSPENREQLQLVLDNWNDVFMGAIARARGIRAEDLHEMASSASIMTASDARGAGLLDDLLYHEQIVALWKQRLGLSEEDDLPLVDERAYTRVTRERAGLRIGNEGEVAIVYADGAIMQGESRFEPNPLLGGTVVGAATFVDAMREARQTERVRAIVLRINSPGGLTPAADEMWHATREAALEKPVIVSMGDYAASGGYWLATAADAIIASPLTITGSIGVYSLFFDFGGLFEDKIGITFDQVRTSPHADMLSGLRSLTAAERGAMQRSVDETYSVFLERVATSRGLSIAAADSLGRGRIWTGLQAEELGLVDQIGSLSDAVRLAADRADLAEGTYRIRILPRPRSFIELFSERLHTYASALVQKGRTTAAERTVLEQLRHVQEIVQTQGTVQARLPTRFHVR